ncbi:transposase [Streptomyces sp. NPDC048383]|uniref:transposase n=1 Tax=Streptomyces sp. NPDC048383 TaxID=3155386 RepID=UPI003418128C
MTVAVCRVYEVSAGWGSDRGTASVPRAGPDGSGLNVGRGLKRYEAEQDWLTTVPLPAYAPDLNPVEAVWSLPRGAMTNTAFDTPDDHDRTLRREIRRIQLRPHLIDGCLAATGLAIKPPTLS